MNVQQTLDDKYLLNNSYEYEYEYEYEKSVKELFPITLYSLIHML